MPDAEKSGDICELCLEYFGFNGEDANGYNSSCVHCGNNTYMTPREAKRYFAEHGIPFEE